MEYVQVAAASLQLSEQLIKVSYGAWKLGQKLSAAPRQIRRKRAQLERIETYAGAIQSIFQGPQAQHDPRNQPLPPNQLDALRSLLVKIQAEFNHLDQILEPLEALIASDSSVGKFWGHVRTLKQEEAMLGNFDRLGELINHLHYFVELHHLQLFCSTAARDGRLLEGVATGQTRLNSDVAVLHQKFDDNARADTGAWQATEKLHSILITQGRSTQSQIAALDASLSLKLDKTADIVGTDLVRLSKEVKALRRSVQLLSVQRLASKPSLIAEVMKHRAPSSPKLCACQRVGRTTRTAFGPVTWRRQIYGVHFPGCPQYSDQSENSSASHYSLTIAGLATRVIEVVFTSTHGSGGLAMPETIEFIRIVHYNELFPERSEPGFDRLVNARLDIAKALEIDDADFTFGATPVRQTPSRAQVAVMKQILLQLRDDLDMDCRSRRFSARMQTPSGYTLLHAFTNILLLTWTIQEDLICPVKDIVTLLSRYGAPVNSVTRSFRLSYNSRHLGTGYRRFCVSDTAISLLTSSLELKDVQAADKKLFLHCLSDIGIDTFPSDRPKLWPEKCFNLFIALPNLAVEYGCSRLALAVIRRQADDLRSILTTRGVVDIELRQPFTPLFFSVNWPLGMRILLDAGTDPSEAVHCAIDQADDSGLAMLLDAGSRMFFPHAEHTSLAWWEGFPVSESLLGYALEVRHSSRPENIRIIPLIVNALADSRKVLMQLARSQISHSALRDLGWQTPEMDQPLLDSWMAATVFQQLQEKCTTVPVNLQPYSRALSVYHTHGIQVDVADALLQAGFTNVDAIASDGSTPLLRHVCHWINGEHSNPLKTTLWFLQHGAKVVVFPVMNGISVSQLLAAGSAQYFRYYRYGHRHYRILGHKIWPRKLSHVLRSLSHLSPHVSRDNCRCYCASEGCSPVTTLLRHTRGSPGDANHDVRRSIQPLFVAWQQLNYPSSDLCPAADFCRFELFERLGMRHTCCRFALPDRYADDGAHLVTYFYGLAMIFVDRNEAMELQEEDEYPHGVLERLMAVFLDLSGRYWLYRSLFWNAWWKVIEAFLPTAEWRVNKVFPYQQVRVDQEIPLLDEERLEGMLQQIRQDVLSWVDQKVLQEEQEDLSMGECMAWLTAVSEE